MNRKPAKATLRLRKESLKTLSSAELAKVPGAASRWIGGRYYPCNPDYDD